MLKSKKRKSDSGGGSEKLSKRPLLSCILHTPGLEDLDFIPLSQIKGAATDKLALLHTIRSRRLAEPHDSPYRMEDVCNQIPEDITGRDLEL